MSEQPDSGDETISSITSFLRKGSRDEMIDEEKSAAMVSDIVVEVVSDLVDDTLRELSKNVFDKNTESENNTSDAKQEVLTEEPVRRSSRLQRLIIQKDKDKKSENKKQKITKNENEIEKKENCAGIMLVAKNSSTESILQHNCNSDLVKSNKDEKAKKSNKTVLKKGVKESVKFNDKTKKPQNKKKKLSSSDLEKSIDEVICDVIKSSMDCAEFPEDNDDKPNIEGTSSTFNETKISEKTRDSTIQHPDNQNIENKDKTLEESILKPVKVKSRWWRSSELEGVLNTDVTSMQQLVIVPKLKDALLTSLKQEEVFENVKTIHNQPEKKEGALLLTTHFEQPVYEHIDENIYKFERKKSRSKKQVKRMVCDCTLTKEELEYGLWGCKEECLNRLLMIECSYRCPLGERCTNKNFQMKKCAQVQIFKTETKGWGLKPLEDISVGDFIMEFVGEVVNHKEYRQRVKLYAKEKNVHCYFMAFKTNEILDATTKGNYSRFINHSCDPNCETQKWTVNGELRVGVFAKRTIYAGQEFTLDYQFQRYGREAQKCYCGADICSGYIGGNKQISIDAYSGHKSSSGKKRKSNDEKKRDLDDLALEDEIEKLNSSKGLRNREETLKLARLMVQADDTKTRHQLMDIIIKTEEQACLRLFLDYHGLPLMWSWMTDIVDVDLKAKILQVLSLLPITNKTMLIDSKIMTVVEKWVQECDASQQVSIKPLESTQTAESVVKKLKIDFSDSETDSSGSHNVNDNSVENSTLTSIPENTFKKDDSNETSSAKSPTESSSPNVNLESKEDLSVKSVISSTGSQLLNNWKNLKEVFRIPRLEQQKRKEDEIEADQSVLKKTEPKPPPIEGDHIQVLISRKTRFSGSKTYEYDNPEMSAEFGNPEMTACNNLLAVCTSNEMMPSFMSKSSIDDLSPKIMQEESVSSMESPSQVLSNAGLVIENTNRAMLLSNTSYIAPPPVNVPPPQLNQPVSHLQQTPPPQAMFPPPRIVYPRPQVPYLDTSAPPPVINHPPTSMQPPLLPPSSQMLQQPPPTTGLPHIHVGLPPNPTFQLPPAPVASIPPGSNQFLPSQSPSVANFTHPPHSFGNQNQSYYFVQPPIQSSTGQTTFTENIYAQAPSFPPPTVNPLPIQTSSFSLPSASSLAAQTIPLQSTNTLPSVNMPPPMPVSMQPATSISMQPPISVSTTSLPMLSAASLPMQPAASLPMQPEMSLSVQSTPTFSMQPTTSIPIESEISTPLQSTTVLPTLSKNFSIEQVKEEPKPVKLPKNWRSATDDEGNVYYYHSLTRETQWDPPTLDQVDDDSEDDEEDSESEESESSDTPTYDEPKIYTKSSKRKSKKRKTTKAAADTSVSFPVRPEIAKKIKELFRTKMSSYIVHCLNSYRKPDCKVGRITSNEDFKYLARKLTHYTMTKELKQCKNVEDLDCNEQVTHKAKDFIKKYMSKYGSKYSRKEKYSP